MYEEMGPGGAAAPPPPAGGAGGAPATKPLGGDDDVNLESRSMKNPTVGGQSPGTDDGGGSGSTKKKKKPVSELPEARAIPEDDGKNVCRTILVIFLVAWACGGGLLGGVYLVVHLKHAEAFG
ncbi:unnamed protein product, partial [Mesorhabditis spiculigera]